MKIRKTNIEDRETKVYIYENKKEESFMTAIPDLEWSVFFTYEEEKAELLKKMQKGLTSKLDGAEAELLSLRIYNWTREM
ncbi:YueH family protein [Falsibacillus pallidus]|uniref:YueH family protein n=1 Tax=Falsibacillus pallidus TaxID=493781 RepID=UPI003D994394